MLAHLQCREGIVLNGKKLYRQNREESLMVSKRRDRKMCARDESNDNDPTTCESTLVTGLRIGRARLQPEVPHPGGGR